VNGGTLGTPGALTGDVTTTGAGLATTIANDAVTTAKILNGNVTLAKQANFPANSLQGNPTGSAATPSAITLGSGLRFNGTTIETTAAGTSSERASLSGNQDVSTTGYVDVTGVSVALAAGTWDIRYSASVAFGYNPGSFCTAFFELNDGAATVTDSTLLCGLRDDVGYFGTTGSRTLRVTLASTTTIKMRVKFDGGTPTWALRRLYGDSATGNTLIEAVRIF
jgi:hypothetical protein